MKSWWQQSSRLEPSRRRAAGGRVARIWDPRLPLKRMGMRLLHVLIADDHPDAADTLAAVLELSGVPVTTAVALDGQQAVELAALQEPDVAILDIEMPFLSGFEVARQLRDQQGTKVRLIAMSAKGQHVAAARSGGTFDSAFQKPLDMEALIQLVSQAAPEG